MCDRRGILALGSRRCVYGRAEQNDRCGARDAVIQRARSGIGKGWHAGDRALRPDMRRRWRSIAYNRLRVQARRLVRRLRQNKRQHSYYCAGRRSLVWRIRRGIAELPVTCSTAEALIGAALRVHVLISYTAIGTQQPYRIATIVE